MNQSFEDACVTGYEDLIPVMRNHEKDRHVVAAAVRAGAHAIITSNVKHFPTEAVEQYNLIVTSPDQFLCHQFHLEPRITKEALERQAADIDQAFTVLLAKLRPSVPMFSELLSKQTQG